MRRGAGLAFLDPLVLADKLAADEPHSFVTYVPSHPEAGHSLLFGVEPRFTPETQELYGTGATVTQQRKMVSAE